jgi:nucleotide-binding universal stress UspA family protein
MIKDILVPIDASCCNEVALAPAFDIARRAQTRIHIVLVHQALTPAMHSADARDLNPYVDTAWRKRDEIALSDLADRCETRWGARPQTQLLDGSVVKVLSECIRRIPIGLVIMMEHDSAISSTWSGIAERLIRATQVPVMLIRHRLGPIRLTDGHILIPLDGSALAEAAVAPAMELGRLMRARYTLLHVPAPLPFVAPAARLPVFAELDEWQSRLGADAYLERVASRMRVNGCTVTVDICAHDVPAQGILDYAARNAVDTIVMATHGRSGLSRLALGSVADEVMRSAMMPIVLYRPCHDESATWAPEAMTTCQA